MNKLLLAETLDALVAATDDACIRLANLTHAGIPEPVEATHRYLANLFRPIITSLLDPPTPDRPKIVCLCGSVRFQPDFFSSAINEERKGRMVLSAHDFTPDNKLAPDVKTRLDELHLAKIDLADEVFVLNVDGYIGESTRRRIDYAAQTKTPIRFLEPPPSTPDPATPP